MIRGFEMENIIEKQAEYNEKMLAKYNGLVATSNDDVQKFKLIKELESKIGRTLESYDFHRYPDMSKVIESYPCDNLNLAGVELFLDVFKQGRESFEGNLEKDHARFVGDLFEAYNKCFINS